MDYDLGALKLMARGGEADIYDAGDGKILRVLRKPAGERWEKEQKLYPLLESRGISVPHCFGFTEVGGKSAELVEKIDGKDMLAAIGAWQSMKKLSELQREVSSVELGEDFGSFDGLFRHFASQPAELSQALHDFSVGIFEKLPKGNQLCHGDFHPGNVLVRDGRFYIIDWMNAYRGNRLADVANTYILMRNTPRLPGQNPASHFVQKRLAAAGALYYLKCVVEQGPFDFAEFSKWIVVMSFLRVYYGLPSEKSTRARYIAECRRLERRGVDAAVWYKKL